jgi:hypothetical protein
LDTRGATRRPHFAEPIEERTVEYDQEALRHFQEDQ